LALAGLFFTAAAPAAAAPAASGEGFAFAVFGDSRIPAYAPYDRSQRGHLDDLVRRVTRYASAGAQPEYQAFFDPESLLLTRLVIPGGPQPAVQAQFLHEVAAVGLHGREGWPEVMVRGQGQRARVTLRAQGQRWVYHNLVRRLRQGAAGPQAGPGFVLHTGDLVYFGFQGKAFQQSPYWRDLNARLLSRLPAGGPGELPARFFPAVGNHEAWGDPEVLGFRQAFPYLADYGFTARHRVYAFDHRGCRFIFLDTGTMNPQAPAEWYQSRPGFGRQMEMLAGWLEEAAAQGRKHVFITFHNPVFCRSGFGPLPPEQNPHRVIKRFAGRLDMTVFNGHVHATEAYRVDGVRYLVVGGGGGEQGFDVLEMPAGYPPDLYWQGEPRQLDYNYLLVRVGPQGLRITLERFRPNQFQPYGRVSVVPGLMD
jgi:hypothetical protein